MQYRVGGPGTSGPTVYGHRCPEHKNFLVHLALTVLLKRNRSCLVVTEYDLSSTRGPTKG